MCFGTRIILMSISKNDTKQCFLVLLFGLFFGVGGEGAAWLGEEKLSRGTCCVCLVTFDRGVMVLLAR